MPWEKKISDTDVFEEESKDKENSRDVDEGTGGGPSENKNHVPITTGRAKLCANLFPNRLRRQNILTQRPRIDALLSVKRKPSNYFTNLKSY